jgi:hypothetical protein
MMFLNPVERRLAYLCGEWLRFRENKEARMLIWQVPYNAFRLVECSIEAQKKGSGYGAGDLFLLFRLPYEHAFQFSRDLKEALCGQYDSSLESLAAEGLPTDWGFRPEASVHTPAVFAEALCSFGWKYHQALGHLVVVLMPPSIADNDGFTNWVQTLLSLNLPERIRLLLVDSQAHPLYLSLAGIEDPRIVASHPQIDGRTVAQETFAQEPAKGPAGVFRSLLMATVTLTEKGTADQVRAKAKDALEFARRQNWLDQEVVLWLLVAGSLLKGKRHDDSIKVYQGARQVADQVSAQKHPAGHKLPLHTWFGEAGAHFAKGDASAASRCYDEAASVAQSDQNLILGIEAFRMGAFCRARLGDTEGTLERGHLAFLLGDQLRPEARSLTTLPYAGVDMLRVLETETLSRLDEIRRDWLAECREATRHFEGQLVQRGDALMKSEEAAMERNYLKALETTKASAVRRLDEVIAAAGLAFRQWFERGRQALGADWPLFSVVGLIAGAASEGGANS